MKKVTFVSAVLCGAVLFSASAFAQKKVPFPDGYRTWTHVTTTVVNDKKHPAYGVRQIFVNDKGRKAALSGAKRFPDGSELVLVFFNIVNLKVPNPRGKKGAKSPKIIVMDKRTRKEVASGRFGGC